MVKTKFEVGDKVKIKNRKEWPKPPGYFLAGAEGTVVQWVDYEEVMAQFRGYVCVRLDKIGNEAQIYTGNNFFFLAENLEKIQ